MGRLLTIALCLAAAAAGSSAAAAAAAAADAQQQHRVLVVGGKSLESTHSMYLADLRARFAVELRNQKDDDLALRRDDTWLYDSLILLAPLAKKLGGGLSSAAILEFVDSGRNLVLAASPSASDFVRTLALEAGVELDDKGTAVYDHFNYQAAGGATDPTLVASSSWFDSPAIFGSSPPQAPVLFQGVAATVPASSELVTVALSGEATAYSADPSKPLPEPPLLPAGATVALVSLVQARNNARVLVAGSLDMFSNAAFSARVQLAGSGSTHSASGNRAFCAGVTLWALQARGVLSAGPLTHHLRDQEGTSPALYRVNDEVEVSLDVQLVTDGKEAPYEADDLQVSFTMLDPYVRQAMTHDGRGRYSLAFKVPDVYGVFKYVIDYNRRGYSYIALQQVVPVRPFRHDEYERFLAPAAPYYASVASTMVAFWLVGLALLYSRP